MDAIVTAGGLCGPDDPLFAATGVSKKALIPLAGRPMVAWIVDALHHASHIDHIVVIGLDEGEVEFGGIPVSLRPNRGNLVDNILAGVEVLQAINPGGGKFTLSSSDIPLITPEIVDGFIEDCLKVDADVYYTVVDKETMERRFPGSNRSFIPLKGGSYAGGDLFLIDLKAVQLNLELLRDLTDSRKNYWAQALKLGPAFILKFIFRRLSLRDVTQRAGRIFGISAVAVKTPYAELAMDLDKPHQYELIKAELEALQV